MTQTGGGWGSVLGDRSRGGRYLSSGSAMSRNSELTRSNASETVGHCVFRCVGHEPYHVHEDDEPKHSNARCQ